MGTTEGAEGVLSSLAHTWVFFSRAHLVSGEPTMMQRLFSEVPNLGKMGLEKFQGLELFRG